MVSRIRRSALYIQFSCFWKKVCVFHMNLWILIGLISMTVHVREGRIRWYIGWVDLIEIENSTRRRYMYTRRINTRNDSKRKYNENWMFLILISLQIFNSINNFDLCRSTWLLSYLISLFLIINQNPL